MITANFFWHGSPMSLYERACLSSFIRNGFNVRVHAFDDLELPAGAALVDARAIAGPEEIGLRTQMGTKGCLASFSNIFRYRLLSREGGWWFDADMFCLADSRRFLELQQTSRGILVGYEMQTQINGAAIYASNPRVAAELETLAIARGYDLEWGEIGPALITRYCYEHPDRVTAVPTHVFYPVPSFKIGLLWDPEARSMCEDAAANSLCVHLVNELLRRRNFPKDIVPCSGSYLESLFSSVGVTSSRAEARLPVEMIRLPATVEWLAGDNARLNQDIARSNQENAALKRDNARLGRDNARLEQDNTALRRRTERLLSSGTWRVGLIVRAVANPVLPMVKRWRHRFRGGGSR